MAIIDASVYVALMNEQEKAHAACWRWFEQAVEQKQILSSPAILVAEVGAALSRGTADTSFARQVVEQLHHSVTIQLLAITPSLAFRAGIIAADYKIRGCDAIYVTLAEQLGRPLVTLDKQQLERGSRVVTTMSPETAV
ncbi:MAG: type II toxin-antitoxin system VapC family toxin [Anaerolineales bacterium]|nr:type II toxin-antitoxin system VapC family toxin [Anaerolineales bacterium]